MIRGSLFAISVMFCAVVPLVCRKSAATAVSMVMCKWLFIALVLLVIKQSVRVILGITHPLYVRHTKVLSYITTL